MPGRPLVGITTYHRDRADRERFHLPGAYVNAVRGAGGLPVLLAPGERRPRDLLPRLDAVILAGGGDIEPARYGGAGHETCYAVDLERDVFELALLDGALERGTPTLAICRGMQVLNVLRGGDLHPHLADLGVSESSHRLSQLEHTEHVVKLAPGSRLARLFAVTELSVASWHHQCVHRLGVGLRAAAWSEEGLVEALELDGAERLLAVQWHPELQIEPGSPQRRLFAELVRLAGGEGQEEGEGGG